MDANAKRHDTAPGWLDTLAMEWDGYEYLACADTCCVSHGCFLCNGVHYDFRAVHRATNTDPWGPTGTEMTEIAGALG